MMDARRKVRWTALTAMMLPALLATTPAEALNWLHSQAR